MTTPVQLALLCIGVAALAGTAYLLIQARRTSPEEREHKRRVAVNARGRLIEGMITDVRDGAVFYSYSWRGIDYDCSQDVSTISELMPRDSGLLIGPATVKFVSQNPYNSIVLSESWSGFPRRKGEDSLKRSKEPQ